jgi:hypothetical protein
LDHWPGSPLRRYSSPAPSERTQWRSLANAVMSAPERDPTEGKDGAHPGHSLRHEHSDPGRLRRDGLTLTLNRMGQTDKALSLGLMAAGTALVFLGLYAGGWSG